jgi:hypothetical protein
MDGDCSELGHTLDRLNVRVLTTGVVLQVALMPLILYGGIASRAGSPAILVATYAFEAVCFLRMAFIRPNSRERVLQLWMSSTLARALQEELVEVAE